VLGGALVTQNEVETLLATASALHEVTGGFENVDLGGQEVILTHPPLVWPEGTRLANAVLRVAGSGTGMVLGPLLGAGES
jgi:hypothetical protein